MRHTINKLKGILPREIQIFHCLAVALININMIKMKSLGIGIPMSLSLVPESEMTEELKDLVARSGNNNQNSE